MLKVLSVSLTITVLVSGGHDGGAFGNEVVGAEPVLWGRREHSGRPRGGGAQGWRG